MPRSDFPRHVPHSPDKLERRMPFSRDPLSELMHSEGSDVDEDDRYWSDLARSCERILDKH